MSIPAVTYNFSNGTTADADQVDQNFQDLINSMTDGTRDFTIGTLSVSGAVSLDGSVTLGNSTIDDLTISASLASSINVKTNALYDFGSATLGLNSIYIGSSGSLTTRIKSGASGSSWTLTLPTSAGTSSYSLRTNGSGVSSWLPQDNNAIQNYSLTSSVATNAMTVALKDISGSDASSTSPVIIHFRSATAATGTPVIRQVTASLNVVISSGATLGHSNGVDDYVHVYAIDNAGTVELAVAGSRVFDEGTLQNTTGVSGSSTSRSVLYSTSSRTGVAVRYLGRLKVNEATAGTWVSNSTEISTVTSEKSLMSYSEVYLQTGSTFGSDSNNKIRRFSDVVRNVGPALTYTDSATAGLSITINEDGIYAIHYYEESSGGADDFGISLNASSLTTGITSLTKTERIALSSNQGTTLRGTVASTTAILYKNDVIRPHSDAGSFVNTDRAYFRIVQLRSLK